MHRQRKLLKIGVDCLMCDTRRSNTGPKTRGTSDGIRASINNISLIIPEDV